MSHFAFGIVGGDISLSFVASAQVNTANITIPSTTLPGDIIILSDGASATGNNPPTSVIPAGFTQITSSFATGNGSTIRNIISYKIAAAGDAGATITGASGSSARKILAVFRPDSPITTVDIQGINDGNSGSSLSQTILASAGSTPVLVIGGMRSSASSAGVGGTLSTGGTSLPSSSTQQVLTYLIQNSDPSDQTWTESISGGTGILQSFYLSVS